MPRRNEPLRRTMIHLREEGWTADIVERHVGGLSFDFLGGIDVIAVDGVCTLGIQVTSGGNHAARRTKMLAEPKLKIWLAAGNPLEIWSWSKRKVKRGGKAVRWTLRTEPLYLGDFPCETVLSIDPVRMPRRL